MKIIMSDTQTNWDEKYLTQVGHFSHVNPG